jgi:hypothetical protein
MLGELDFALALSTLTANAGGGAEKSKVRVNYIHIFRDRIE